MSDKLTGEVKWFNNEIGYGFIVPDKEPTKEYFVHFSSIVSSGFKTLQAGQKVTFDLRDTPKGTQAVDVVPGW